MGAGTKLLAQLVGSLIKTVFDVRTGDDYSVALKTASNNLVERKIAEKELEHRNNKK